MIDLDSPVTQAQFGEIVGVTQQAVSDFIKVAALGPGVPLGVMLQAYCGRLREQAAGRGSDGELDLVQERAWLAREQRIAQALKNATTRKEFAPIGRLSEVLAAASGSVAAKLDALPAAGDKFGILARGTTIEAWYYVALDGFWRRLASATTTNLTAGDVALVLYDGGGTVAVDDFSAVTL